MTTISHENISTSADSVACRNLSELPSLPPPKQLFYFQKWLLTISCSLLWGEGKHKSGQIHSRVQSSSQWLLLLTCTNTLSLQKV